VRPVTRPIAAIAATALLGLAADAGAAMRTIDVPGVAGRSVEIAAAGRLADGGAIVAATVTPQGRQRPRIVVMRLRHDGLIDRSWGDAGVVSAQLARGGGRGGSRSTSVAVDAAGGRSWIGAAIGTGGAGAVLALDAHGRRARGFGSQAVLRLGDAGAPSALAFGGGRLAIAAARGTCAGCEVVLVDAAGGARRAEAALAPVAGAAPCAGARLDSLATSSGGRLALAGTGGSCPARIVVRDGALGPLGEWDPGDAAQRVVVAAAGAPLELCAGVQRAGAVSVVRVGAQPSGPALPRPSWAPVAGSLAGVVSLGDGACGALLLRPGGPARVLQASNGDAAPAIAVVPAGLRAGAIYHCRRHLLVVGTRRRDGLTRASVAVTAIVRD
jgi:hypothetical protein